MDIAGPDNRSRVRTTVQRSQAFPRCAPDPRASMLRILLPEAIAGSALKTVLRRSPARLDSGGCLPSPLPAIGSWALRISTAAGADRVSLPNGRATTSRGKQSRKSTSVRYLRTPSDCLLERAHDLPAWSAPPGLHARHRGRKSAVWRQPGMKAGDQGCGAWSGPAAGPDEAQPSPDRAWRPPAVRGRRQTRGG